MDYYTLPQESFDITTSGLAVIEVLPFFLLLLILYVVSTLLSKFCITSIAFYFFVYQCNIDLLQPSQIVFHTYVSVVHNLDIAYIVTPTGYTPHSKPLRNQSPSLKNHTKEIVLMGYCVCCVYLKPYGRNSTYVYCTSYSGEYYQLTPFVQELLNGRSFQPLQKQ